VAAPVTTWLLVTATPSGETMNPDPEPAAFSTWPTSGSVNDPWATMRTLADSTSWTSVTRSPPSAGAACSSSPPSSSPPPRARAPTMPAAISATTATMAMITPLLGPDLRGGPGE
jgi:hypothetical protein